MMDEKQEKNQATNVPLTSEESYLELRTLEVILMLRDSKKFEEFVTCRRNEELANMYILNGLGLSVDEAFGLVNPETQQPLLNSAGKERYQCISNMQLAKDDLDAIEEDFCANLKQDLQATLEGNFSTIANLAAVPEILSPEGALHSLVSIPLTAAMTFLTSPEAHSSEVHHRTPEQAEALHQKFNKIFKWQQAENQELRDGSIAIRINAELHACVAEKLHPLRQLATILEDELDIKLDENNVVDLLSIARIVAARKVAADNNLTVNSEDMTFEQITAGISDSIERMVGRIDNLSEDQLREEDYPTAQTPLAAKNISQEDRDLLGTAMKMWANSLSSTNNNAILLAPTTNVPMGSPYLPQNILNKLDEASPSRKAEIIEKIREASPTIVENYLGLGSKTKKS